jgi:MFS family permease
MIPAFAVSPIAGVWVDRWNNKKTMIICDMIRGCLMLTFPAFVALHQFMPIYLAIFLIFTCACFFLPAKFAIVPDLVSGENLLIANSFSTIISVVGGVAGLTFGGIVLEFIDVNKTIYLNAIIYFASAASLSLIRYSPTRGAGKVPGVVVQKIKEVLKTSFIHELKEGFKYLFVGKRVRFVIYVLFFMMSMVGAIYVVSVVFVQEVMGSMTKDVGLFGLFLCAGLLLGSYFYGKSGHAVPTNRTIYLSIILSGSCIALFSICLKLTASFLAGGIFSFLLGLAASPVFISSSTIVHENVDETMRGRIFSSLGIIMNLGLLIFMFISSSLAEIVGKLWILLLSALVFVIFGIAGILVGYTRERKV